MINVWLVGVLGFLFGGIGASVAWYFVFAKVSKVIYLDGVKAGMNTESKLQNLDEMLRYKSNASN